jgi:hypothetical protein
MCVCVRAQHTRTTQTRTYTAQTGVRERVCVRAQHTRTTHTARTRTHTQIDWELRHVRVCACVCTTYTHNTHMHVHGRTHSALFSPAPSTSKIPLSPSVVCGESNEPGDPPTALARGLEVDGRFNKKQGRGGGGGGGGGKGQASYQWTW